jgi:hydroxymethylpyrimidine/phosphomethylpyrimidine kinase
VVDVLFDGRDLTECTIPRVHSRSVHGTGCTFSAALAAYLACGVGLAEAAALAQAYVAGAIRHSMPLGKGQMLLNHFWDIARRKGEG